MQKSSINVIVILMVIIFAFAMGWIYFQPNTDTHKSKSAQLAPTPVSEIPRNWKTLSNLNHTFMYPPEAKAEARETESLVFFMGQEQIDSGRTQTELFDGYSFRIGAIDAEPNMTLEQIAKKERDSAKENCQSEKGQISELKSIIISKEVSFQYMARGCYINYTETLVSYKESIFRISQSYVGNTNNQDLYEKITNQIFSTLKFVD